MLSESNRLKQSTAAKLFNKTIPIAGMAVLILATVYITGSHFLLNRNKRHILAILKIFLPFYSIIPHLRKNIVHKRVRNVEMEILGVTPDFNTFKLSDSRRVVHFPLLLSFLICKVGILTYFSES